MQLYYEICKYCGKSLEKHHLKNCEATKNEASKFKCKFGM